MNIVSLTGADTIIIGGQLITTFATGEVAMITFPNDIVQVQRGKGGNTIYALNNTGFQSELKLRIMLGYADDVFLNTILAQQKGNFSGFSLLSGVFVKNVGDGTGNIHPITYIMSGGVIKRQPEAKSVSEGDPTQSLVEWDFIFGNNTRTIG